MLAREEVRIVVVDDSVELIDVMATLLNAQGYTARGAGNATTALGLIHQWLPHGVVLDIDMPGIDGVDLARHLRANYGRSICLIALSGWDATHSKVRAIAGIVDHCLSKPCHFGELLGLLEPLRTPRPR